MVLFFVMSLVAMYASRNIIFEQKSATNLHQSNASFQTADAGFQWALGMLNGGRINDACQASANPSDLSFRQRYLQADRYINLQPGVRTGPLWPTCWFDSVSGNWVCHCPGDPSSPGSVSPPPASGGYVPSFQVRFLTVADATPSTAPRAIRLEVAGCIQFDPACLNFQPPHSDLCGGTVCAVLALSPALKTAPAAALTARQAINVGGTGLTVGIGSGGSGFSVAAISGSSIAGINVASVAIGAGLPSGGTIIQSASVLADPDFNANRQFAAVFGVWPDTYIEQPGAFRVNCSSACSASQVRNAAEQNPGRPLVLDGDVVLDGGADVGNATNPVVMVVNGDLTFTVPTTVWGLIFVRTSNWATAGLGMIHGAVVADNQIGGTGGFTVVYDAAVLERARQTMGSYVLVPGGWKDFR